MHTKHQLNLDPNPEGNLEKPRSPTKRWPGREARPVRWGGAGATQGVPGDPRPLSDRDSCTVANGGASVPEVLAPAKLPLRFVTEGMLRLSVFMPAWKQRASSASRRVSWAALVLPVCFLQEWMWSPNSSMT